ncbi:MAG TPA: neutral/alkaline non-lysosomal ceramidase N-terminal domain-containing protein, partial [Aquabacterium sp.]|nr:neutral/alkaline non-lysosomal ceramidase N-terminal domain-containing protein [Aquabacterium sp.]
MMPRHRHPWRHALALSLSWTLGSAQAASPLPAAPASPPYLVGAGISDITGEAADIGMFGYAQLSQRTSGIHQRLRARAFVVEDPRTRQAVVLVVADAGAIMQGVHQEVLRRLQQRHGSRYTERNVLLTATHTHAGPGGYSHHTLYNITILGHKPATFEAMVDGIVEAIDRAHGSRAPGSIRLSQGELSNASRNRAAPAFDANPAAERQAFPQGIDPLMSVLTFRRGTQDIGALSFFPTHGTSMTNTNTLISG